MASLPLVLVTWDDAWGNKDDEVTLEDVASTHIPQIVKTVGWLLHQDEKGVSVVNEEYGTSFRGRTFIPAAMIKSIEPVIKKRRRKSAPPTVSPA